MIDSAQNAWKSFVSGLIFFHWACIGFSGSFAFFYGKDMSLKNEVLFDREHEEPATLPPFPSFQQEITIIEESEPPNAFAQLWEDLV